MEINQNPFSLYDFLGYLVPGICCVSGLMYVFTPEILRNIIIGENLNIVTYFLSIIVCYISGHMLSYLSSITIEKYSIWTLGYPSRYLLKYDIPGFWRYFWRKKSHKIDLVLADKKILEVSIKEKVNISLRIQRFFQWFIRLLMCGVIIPVVLTDLTFRRVLSYREFLGKSLDSFLAEKIQKKIDLFQKEQYEDQSSNEKLSCAENVRDPDFFRLIYHYANEHTKNHFGKMQNYVALYGFTRTLCFTGVVLFWSWFINTLVTTGLSWGIVWISLMFFLGIAILYLDFNKFFRRYSLEALMAFTAIYQSQ